MPLNFLHAPFRDGLLEDFYHKIYLPSFPDPNERESLENIQEYLHKKQHGWYQSNDYHVIIATGANNEIYGGIIADYLSLPNVGVIEFLATSPAHRGQGVAGALLQELEKILNDNAIRNGKSGVACIVAEMDNPRYFTDDITFPQHQARAAYWQRRGYQQIDFPYVQPALHHDSTPVTHLFLIIKPLCNDLQEGIPSGLLRDILHEYLYWAMRIPHPENNPQFQEMAAYLQARQAPSGYCSLASFTEMPPS